MKLSILYLVTLAIVMGSCKKESENNLSPVNQTSEFIKTKRHNFIHPYFIKYKSYQNDLNTMYKNFITRSNNNGC